MTSTELKEILESIANTLDQGAKVFPFKLNNEVIKILSNLDDTSIKLLSTLLSTDSDNIKSIIPSVINLLQAGDKLFRTDEHTKISNLCRRLANRNVILAVIARII